MSVGLKTLDSRSLFLVCYSIQVFSKHHVVQTKYVWFAQLKMLILKRNIACYPHSYSGREPRNCGSRAYVPPWHHVAGVRQVLIALYWWGMWTQACLSPCLSPHGFPTSKTGVETVCLGFSHFNSRILALIPLSLSCISLDLSMSLLSNEKAHLFQPLMLIVLLSPFIFTVLQVFSYSYNWVSGL